MPNKEKLSTIVPHGFPFLKHSKKAKPDETNEAPPKPPSFAAEEIGYFSDVGKVRAIDEDSVFVAKTYFAHDSNPALRLFMVVADGMGGHNKGEVASALGLITAAELIVPKLTTNGEDTDYLSLLTSSIKEANQKILKHSAECPECEGMGTTMTAMIIDNENLYIGHVGDTRAYLISGEKVIQLTKDHSLVQQMVDSGEISPEQARTHPHKNVITRVVGYYTEVDVDVYKFSWNRNDQVLMCCDGLVIHLEDQEIASVVRSSGSPQEACELLIKQANNRGGRDNISVIVTPPLGLLFEEADSSQQNTPDASPLTDELHGPIQ